MGKGLSKCCNTRGESSDMRSISQQSSTSTTARVEVMKMQKFKERLKLIKENEDEYESLKIIDDALMEFKVFEEDINKYYQLGRKLG